MTKAKFYGNIHLFWAKKEKKAESTLLYVLQNQHMKATCCAEHSTCGAAVLGAESDVRADADDLAVVLQIFESLLEHVPGHSLQTAKRPSRHSVCTCVSTILFFLKIQCSAACLHTHHVRSVAESFEELIKLEREFALLLDECLERMRALSALFAGVSTHAGHHDREVDLARRRIHGHLLQRLPLQPAEPHDRVTSALTVFRALVSVL